MKPTRPVLDQGPADLYRLPEQARVLDTRDGISEEHRNIVLTRHQMIRLVEDSGLDLLQVSPDDAPQRVYKLLDYGKYRFEQQKRQREQERKQRENTRTLKECFMRPGITEHDYEVKAKQVRAWIADHDVKIGMKLDRKSRAQMGRHTHLHDLARDPEFVLNRLIAELGDMIQATRLSVSDRLVSTILRPN